MKNTHEWFPFCISLVIISMSTYFGIGRSFRFRTKMALLTTWCVGMLLWPLIWKRVLGNQNYNNRAVLPGLIWPFIMQLYDIHLLKSRPHEIIHESKRHSLFSDASSICGMTFSLSGILGASGHSCCSHIFLIAILGCVAFVMPAPHSYSTTITTVVIEAVQKLCLTYSTGLMLSGVLLMNDYNRNQSMST